MYENPERVIRAIDNLLKSRLSSDPTKRILLSLREEIIHQLPAEPFIATKLIN